MNILALPFGPQREDEIIRLLHAGRIAPIQWITLLIDDLLIECSSDYVAIVLDDGSSMRMPMAGYTAQKVADKFEAILPTPLLVDYIWAHSIKLEPIPMDTNGMLTAATFFEHNKRINEQLAAMNEKPDLALVSGCKKDVVLTNRLTERPPKVAIYGWHRKNGVPIQSLSLFHPIDYADYSHGVRLVRRKALLNQQIVDLSALLQGDRHSLISKEKLVIVSYFDAGKVPIPEGAPAKIPNEHPQDQENQAMAYEAKLSKDLRSLPKKRIEEDARAIILKVFQIVYGRLPTIEELQLAQAHVRVEGYYGIAEKPIAWQGSHNWGAMQAGHGPPCGENAFLTKDSHADGKVYVWCYKRYRGRTVTTKDGTFTLNAREHGAWDVLRWYQKRPRVLEALKTGNAFLFALALRRAGYHESKPTKYGKAVFRNAYESATLLNEPLKAYYAAEGVGLDVIVTPGTTLSYMKRIDASMDALNADIASQGQGQFKTSWQQFYQSWKQFFADHQGWFSRLSGAVYDEAEKYDRELDKWRASFESNGGKPTAPSMSEPTRNWFGLALGGVVAAGAYYLLKPKA